MLQIFFNISLAFRAIRTNLLRSVLTILIIGLGIMALVGILTGIEIIKAAVFSNFSSMGANSFQVTSDILKQKKKKQGGLSISITEGKSIRWEEAKAFKERFPFPATIGISMTGGEVTTVAFGDKKTNPNIQAVGVDESYFTIVNIKMEAGRAFSPYELQAGSLVCVLGHGVASKLFKDNFKKALGQSVSAGSARFTVIGVAEEKGGSMIMNADNTIYMPLQAARALYGGNQSYLLNVMVHNIAQKPVAGDEAEGLFRVIRKIPLGSPNNFSINQNDSLASILLDSIRYIRWAAVLIGIITLLGSVIGLMNIMLVSVAERTRDIGVSKALGAKQSAIKGQFLTESVMISIMGGLLGVVLGILVGNLFSLALNTGFIIPWIWMITGISLCAAVGIISGIYPAVRASRLDPIVALRYE